MLLSLFWLSLGKIQMTASALVQSRKNQEGVNESTSSEEEEIDKFLMRLKIGVFMLMT